jgi:hypothetical protein
MEKQPLPEDFKEFIQCLNSSKVEYLLIGGWAVALHGHPRATKDIDFFVSIDNSNLENLKEALNSFGAPPFDTNYLSEKGNILILGVYPIRIDIINEASGIDFKDCYQRRRTIIVDDIEIPLISKADLIKNKKSTGRLSDLGDVEKLEYLANLPEVSQDEK